ncbi:hypothetical protein CFHF_22240 [Caulobacter flavus]|uniref:Uncharacterized protein n=1 Tax=Caulobacter flavus TaxID=1679497 RepID=A0A2N5CNC5_9CAUL|nr:hypothetical protein [Caulobacter flavus]AYV46708.1 hypothetical protein C1707_10765 [Caulobacter flavus]PLR07945.1 hypothetical protein CFHF_22240 [Caulobacter flavus]
MSIRMTATALAAFGLAVVAASPAPAQTAPTSQAQPETRPFPHSNGPLSGMALFIPDAQVSEFHKPSHEAPKVSILHRIRVGEVVALKVTFIGPQLDAANEVDVTYDIDFVGPDGKVLRNGSLMGLKVIKGRVSAPEAVFDNTAVVPKISFDARDAKGLYKAVVVLHDNIAKRDLSMTAEITLQ